MIELRNRIISFRASILIGIILILFSVSTCQRFEPESLIVITTDTIETLSESNYRLTGTFINLGEEEITQHGFCWAEQRNPTTTGQTSQLEKRSSKGSFFSIISNLTANRTYYVRSYAISVAGTKYGDEESFVTESNTPTVITFSVTDATETTAQGGGNVTIDGGATITARGICWSTTQNPTTANFKTTEAGTTGNFSSTLSGLTCSTTYYVRAYATNSSGTAYGNQVLFTTSTCPAADPPTVTTLSVTGATETTAQGGGNVTDDGGAVITERGVCWNTTGSPTTSDPKTTDAGTTGSYTSSLTGLSPFTTYYIRAYASNSAGTSYGSVMTIKTDWDNSATVSDKDGNQYGTCQIGEQVWITEDMATTQYADGTPINRVDNSSAWASLGDAEKAYCWYNNNSSNGDTFGALYTWAAAMDGAASSNSNPSGVQGVCPDGWHIPSDAEWKELEMYLGMSQSDADNTGWDRGSSVGDKLKESGIVHWQSPNTGDNSSGFTALPGGYRSPNDGDFMGIYTNLGFWSASEDIDLLIWDRGLENDRTTVFRGTNYKNTGFSVRCLMDE